MTSLSLPSAPVLCGIIDGMDDATTKKRVGRPPGVKHPPSCGHCGGRARGVPLEHVDPAPSCPCHKIEMAWHKSKSSVWGGRWQCRVRRLEYMRNYNLAAFAMTEEDYQRLWEAQGGCCAVCKRPDKRDDYEVWSQSDNSTRRRRLAVDHDHATGRVRGLLCSKCNGCAGWFEMYRQAFLQHLEGK